MFVNLNGMMSPIARPEQGRYQITITPGNSHLKTKLLQLGMRDGCYWIKQSWSEVPPVIEVCGKKCLKPKWRIKTFPGLLCSTSKINKYNIDYSKTFFNLDDWFEMYSVEKFSFAFGTRFHGNMVAMHSGVPALWITHDSRTRELADFLHLPSAPLETINKIKHVEDLFKYCCYDETIKHYKSLCKNYVDFLEENRIGHLYNIE